MKVYVVVKESSSSNTIVTSSYVLGVFIDETSAINCIDDAYQKYVIARDNDSTLLESCYISEKYLTITDDTPINLAKDKCPKPDGFFHQTDESIYCMGFIEGYECKLATVTE